MALGLNFGTGADNDGETLFSAFTKINNFLSSTTVLGNGDLQLNSVTIGKGNGSQGTNLVIGQNTGLSLLPIDNTQGDLNVFVGLESGQYTTSGRANTFIGVACGRANTVGSYNAYVGVNTGRNALGSNNAFFGQAAGENNTGQSNTFVGAASGALGSSGNYGTFVGNAAGLNNTGQNNTFVGQSAGINNTSGYNHVFVGQSAGANQNGSYNNTFVGASAGSTSSALWNATAIGADAQPNASNTVTLGNGVVSALRCQVTSITGLSDARDKTDIIEISEGLEFVDNLKPVTFTWNQRDNNRIGTKAAGFVAQDLLELQNESSIGENLDLVSEADPERLEARYSNLLPVLVKAIQELSLEVKSLKSEIELLKAI